MERFGMPRRLSKTSQSMTGKDTQNPRRGHAASASHPKRRLSRNRSLALLLSSVLAGAMLFPKYALPETTQIAMPADARLHGLESLRLAVQQDGGVPLPTNLDEVIRDR